MNRVFFLFLFFCKPKIRLVFKNKNDLFRPLLRRFVNMISFSSGHRNEEDKIKFLPFFFSQGKIVLTTYFIWYDNLGTLFMINQKIILFTIIIIILVNYSNCSFICNYDYDFLGNNKIPLWKELDFLRNKNFHERINNGIVFELFVCMNEMNR